MVLNNQVHILLNLIIFNGTFPGKYRPETPCESGNLQKSDFSTKFRGKTRIPQLKVKDGNSVRGAVAQNYAGSD